MFDHCAKFCCKIVRWRANMDIITLGTSQEEGFFSPSGYMVQANYLRSTRVVKVKAIKLTTTIKLHRETLQSKALTQKAT